MHKDFKKVVPGCFLVTFGHMKTLQKELNFFVVGKSRTWPPLTLTAPCITQKKIVLFIRFMVLKTTGLSSRFQRKNRFWKICTGSREINQYMLKFMSPNQTFIFWDVFGDIFGPSAYFSKPIFALKPWAQAGRFEYHKPSDQKNFFLSYKGGCQL